MRRIARGIALFFVFIGSACAQAAPVEEEHTPTAMPQSTWVPPAVEIHGKLSAAFMRSLPASAFAFPRTRKEPLTDAAHVRSAVARFRQVKGVSDEERELAFANIRKAAQYFSVRVKEDDWHCLIVKRATGDFRAQ